MKKKDTDLRKLLPHLERLPEETREGLVRFLEMVLAVDRALREVGSQAEALQCEDDPGWMRGEESAPDIRRLFRMLGSNLTDQQPDRRDLVLGVLASSRRAYELGQEASGKLLLQLAIIMTAGQEDAASAEVQGIVCAAGLAIAKSQGNSERGSR